MIRTARLFEWGGAVPPEVGSARRPFARRSGLLLALTDDDGRCALGEATPLPDAAGVDASAAAVAAFDWRRAPLPGSAGELARLIDGAGLPPAAAFAIDTALAALAADRAAMSLAGWLCAEPAQRVPRSVYAGVIGDDATLARATRARDRGARTIKLKAPCLDVHAEASWLVALRRTLGAGLGLRLDCNGGLPLADAPTAIAAFAAADLELVEEPCAHDALLELGELAVPWFADESMARPELAVRLLAHRPLAGVVLKPTSIGGLLASLRLAERAIERGKQVIVTHAFEGPVALAACAELALALGERALAPGLDLHAGLEAFPAWPVPQLPRDGAFVEREPAVAQGRGDPTWLLGNLVTKLPSGERHPIPPGEEVWSWTR